MEGLTNNIENKNRQFKAKLASILNRTITVENIDDYIDSSMDDLIALTEEVVNDYKARHPEDQSTGKELEDKAFFENKLSTIGQYLDVAQEKMDQLNKIDEYITGHLRTDFEVIVPPDINHRIMPGTNRFTEPDIKHRVKSLLYALSGNGIELENVGIMNGILHREMMRDQSYVIVNIPEINRLALICDEEGNASYIFDSEKMREGDISSDMISNMTKDQLNDLINANPGIGVRFVYSKNWISRAESFLFDEIAPRPEPAEPRIRIQRNIENLPRTSNMELDPWKNFWTDPETGRHWGTKQKIARKLSSISLSVIEASIKADKLISKEVFDPDSGHIRQTYCFEDFSNNNHVIELSTAPLADKEGEWKGFYTDKNEKHWATTKALGLKLGLDRKTILKFMEKTQVSNLKIRSSSGPIETAYCYEDLIKNPQIKKFIETPKAQKEGEWEGFYIDKDGKHWGATQTLSTKVLTSEILRKLVKDYKFSSIEIIDKAGHIIPDAYNFEEINDSEVVKRYLTTPSVSKEGKWKGFYTDNDGKHWGSSNIFDDRNMLSVYKIKKLADTGKIKKIPIRDITGRITEAFSFEEISEIIKNENQS